MATRPISHVIQEAAYARDVAERAVRYAESSTRIYHGLYDKHREAIEALQRRVDALEARAGRGGQAAAE